MHANVHRFTNVYNAPAASLALPFAALHIRRLYADVSNSQFCFKHATFNAIVNSSEQ